MIQKNKKNLNVLNNLVKSCNIQDKFYFHGKKSVGEELFSMYRQSDIFVSSSTGSEGFPRTIWESMANSCVVIATKAGSVPEILTHKTNALLVNKNSPEEIASSILTLKNDIDLSNNLISNALELAKTNTLENQSLKMINILKNQNKRESLS